MKMRVLAALANAPNHDGLRLSECKSLRVYAARKGAPKVCIVPGRGHYLVGFGEQVARALDVAGLKYRYDIDDGGPTEGRFVVSPGYAWFSIPLDQETGPWGFVG